MNGIYQLLMMMVRLFVILIISTLLTAAFAQSKKFCSPVCGTKCDGNLNSKCASSCQDSAWLVSGNTCIPKASIGWKLFDSSPDYNGGTLTMAGATSTIGCGDMNYYGFVNPSVTISVSTAGITVPYFAMKVYFGIVAVDVNCWNNNGNNGGSGWCGSGPNPLIQYSTLFQVNFNNPQGAAVTNPVSTSTVSNNPTRGDRCGSVSNFRQYYWRVGLSYPVYSIQNTTLQWDITCTQTANASALWGIRQFLIIIQSCNVACITCFGPAVTQCTVCAANYWLSNTTCSLTCLSRFGQSNNFICVYCDLKCTQCYMEMDNCSACTASGIWASFLSTTINSNYPICNITCPEFYFGNKVTRTCDLCNTGCQACINSATYCTSCINGSYYWTGWACYNPCPPGYFTDTNLINCTRCSPFCSVCQETSTNCTVCTLTGQYKAFLENSTAIYGNCTRVCSNGFYGETFNGAGPNICIACDINCSLCTGYPTPCTQCIAGFYLISSSCTDTCPNGTVAFNSSGTGLCLNCDVVCVDLTIKMYFPSVVNDKIYIDMIFNQNLNYSTFDQIAFQDITITSQNIQYTNSMFTFTYQNISGNAYRITIEPKTYIFLYNATFTVTTKDQPVPVDVSKEKMPFKSSNYRKTAYLSWFLIKGPPFSSIELGIMNALSKLSTKTNKILTHPYVQQIKKTGVFALLFSGAQITSCSMLSNQIQSQNLYEGVRIFAVFIFFDAPPYQSISDKTKRFFQPTVQDKIRNSQQITPYSSARTLFSTDKMYWRFQRTGQTSFFIYDVYMPMFLMILCWIGMIVAYCSTKKRWYISYSSSLYSAIHKIHQMSMMYITMASIVQFIYFQPTSSQRVISAIVCIVFNVYFVFYELYIYQDMIKYPLAQIGNKYYDYFVLRYGFFLKNIRFEQYDPSEEWTPKHWFRPYNFHILSYYKKFLMIITLPLFYSVLYAQMGILMFLQLLELFRVWAIWPFIAKSRNIFRLTLEFALFMFFMINTIQISVLQTIMQSDVDGLQKSTKIFYGLGWAGFAFCMYFNLGHVCIGIYDLCVGLKTSNRAKMDKARKIFYAQKIGEYQKDNQSSSKVLVNRWVKLGNLNDKTYGELPEVNIRIELYQFKKVTNKFQLRIKKITSLKMKKQFKKLRRSNNTTVGGKIQRDLILSQGDNSRLYNIINEVYRQYQGPHVETIRIKTFLNIWQKDYEEGQDITFDRNMMFQRVELISYDNQVNQFKIQALLDDFPIKQAIINHAI